MTRKTSIEAYRTIQENGLLGRRQFQYYEVLYNHGPLTNVETARLVEQTYGLRMSRNGTGSRMKELMDMGLVAEVGKRKDSSTKMEVTLWDVTDHLPGPKPSKKETKAQIIARQSIEISNLKARIAFLEKGPQQELF